MYESKYYLKKHTTSDNCRVMIRSEYKDNKADYTNVWIMGEPFLKAYYSVYDLKAQTIGLVRVADATRLRYNIPDDTRHNAKCTD